MRARCRRRTKLLLVLGTVGLCLGGFLLVILLVHGIDGVVALFTKPWIDGPDGGRYNVAGAVRRGIEIVSEPGGDRDGKNP